MRICLSSMGWGEGSSRERELKEIENFIKNIHKFVDFFKEACQKGNNLNTLTFHFYPTYEYDYNKYLVTAYLYESGEIGLITTCECGDDSSSNTQRYVLNSKRKMRIPKSAIKDCIEDWQITNCKFAIEISEILYNAQIFIHYSTLEHALFRFADAMPFWSVREHNFYDYKINLRSLRQEQLREHLYEHGYWLENWS